MVKRKILLLLTMLVTLTLVACGHNHNFSTDLVKDDSKHWFVCDCGEKKDEAAHDYTIASEYVVAPTCEEGGVQIFSCICGAIVEKEVPANGHKYSTSYSKDADQHWYECVCGLKKDVATHNYKNSGKLLVVPTCEKEGLREYTCVCGASIQKTLPANGHKYNNLETNWDNYVTDVTSSAPTRYSILAHTTDDGLYIRIEQYVDSYRIATDPSDWNSTHVEMELWNHGIGYGWDGTYFAFFANGSYYINNQTNCNGVYNCAQILENGSDSTYKYTIIYDIYIAFSNNLDNPQDGSYAFCQFMFLTPGEDDAGYENVTTIAKDGWRVLWTDKCSSYEVRSNGIVRKDKEY